MKQLNIAGRLALAGIAVALVLPGCMSFKQTAKHTNSADQPQIRITMIEAYQGVRDGNIESVQLPGGSAFITVKLCIENLSPQPQTIFRHDVFLSTGDTAEIYPVALGYDQAEAFNWLLPIAAPLGAKRITHKFYFFLIQNVELMTIPAYQSLGCKTSSQFTSLAPLFIVKKSMAGEPYTLHFLGAQIPLSAKRDSPLLAYMKYVKWAVGGAGGILIVVVLILLWRRRSRAQAPLVPEQSEDAKEG